MDVRVHHLMEVAKVTTPERWGLNLGENMTTQETRGDGREDCGTEHLGRFSVSNACGRRNRGPSERVTTRAPGGDGVEAIPKRTPRGMKSSAAHRPITIRRNRSHTTRTSGGKSRPTD